VPSDCRVIQAMTRGARRAQTSANTTSKAPPTSVWSSAYCTELLQGKTIEVRKGHKSKHMNIVDNVRHWCL